MNNHAFRSGTAAILFDAIPVARWAATRQTRVLARPIPEPTRPFIIIAELAASALLQDDKAWTVAHGYTVPDSVTPWSRWFGKSLEAELGSMTSLALRHRMRRLPYLP